MDWKEIERRLDMLLTEGSGFFYSNFPKDNLYRALDTPPAWLAWAQRVKRVIDSSFARESAAAYLADRGLMAAGLVVGRGESTFNEARDSLIGALREGKKIIRENLVEEMLNTPQTEQLMSYRFHSKIEEVSGQLYRDGHYKQAVLEAYICVINEVREKSGLTNLDGDPLMNRAFGCERQTPVIQINNLTTAAEVDEQKGYLYLYKGIVALRNAKAHSNTLFNSFDRAHSYLALASALLWVLEIVQVNPTN